MTLDGFVTTQYNFILTKDLHIYIFIHFIILNYLPMQQTAYLLSYL